MNVAISIASTDSDGRVFLTWTPVEGTARLIDGPGAGQTVKVQLQNAGTVGKDRFRSSRDPIKGTSTLQLDLPGDGTPVRFWVAGELGEPSQNFGDAVLQVVDATTSATLSSTPLMVRIRKNANSSLPTAERDRFLAAFGTLNGQGTGRFTDFRNMHNEADAWRILTTIGDFCRGTVAICWTSNASCRVIDRNCDVAVLAMGQSRAADAWRWHSWGFPIRLISVQFTPGHPFNQWTTEGQLGIVRGTGFPPTQAPGLKSEAAITHARQWRLHDFRPAVRQPPAAGRYRSASPHGGAHTSYGSGYIINPASAPRDPLFFLLHDNVDRLWAKWQWYYKRTKDTDPNAFYNGAASAGAGHNLGDTMWPWNDVKTATPSEHRPGGPDAVLRHNHGARPDPHGSKYARLPGRQRRRPFGVRL